MERCIREVRIPYRQYLALGSWLKVLLYLQDHGFGEGGRIRRTYDPERDEVVFVLCRPVEVDTLELPPEGA